MSDALYSGKTGIPGTKQAWLNREGIMVTLKYRLLGYDTVISKEFKTREDAMAWAKAQGNICIVEIESSGVETLKRIFG